MSRDIKFRAWDALQSLEYAREEAKGPDKFISQFITAYVEALNKELSDE